MTTDDELQALRSTARRVDAGPVRWEAPSEDVWDRIAAAVDPLGGSEHPTDRGVDALARRRSSRLWGSVLVAAAAVLVIIVVISVASTTRRSDEMVASAVLEPLGAQGAGDAWLFQHDGRYQLDVVAVDVEPGADDYLELWLIDPEVTKLVSLGPLRPDGRYEVPPGIDPRDFPVVDVSVEPVDGDPTHSGDSVLRGLLTF